MSSRTSADKLPVKNASSQESRATQVANELIDGLLISDLGHTPRPSPWADATEVEAIRSISQTKQTSTQDQQVETVLTGVPLTRSKITENDAEATNFIFEKMQEDESNLDSESKGKGEIFIVIEDDEHENKDQDLEQKANDDQDQSTIAGEETSPNFLDSGPDPQGTEENQQNESEIGPEDTNSTHEKESEAGPEDAGSGHENEQNEDNDHTADTTVLITETEPSALDLPLPPLRRKIVPCYPYATIIPTCKPLIGKDKKAKNQRNKRCKSPGKWRGPLKEVMNSLLELQRIEESQSELNKISELEEEEEEDENAKKLKSQQDRKRSKAKKTVAQADAMLRFKMTEMQAIFTVELKELHDTFEKLKKKPNPHQEEAVEAMWLKRREQFQTEIDDCIDAILDSIKSIF